MRLFWNFRNCFNPINFLFKLYIYVVSLCTHYYPLNGLVECCDEIYVTNQLPGARKYSCIDQTLEICICNCRHNIESFKTETFTTVFERTKTC